MSGAILRLFSNYIEPSPAELCLSNEYGSEYQDIRKEWLDTRNRYVVSNGTHNDHWTTLALSVTPSVIADEKYIMCDSDADTITARIKHIRNDIVRMTNEMKLNVKSAHKNY